MFYHADWFERLLLWYKASVIEVSYQLLDEFLFRGSLFNLDIISDDFFDFGHYAHFFKLITINFSWKDISFKNIRVFELFKF